MATINDPNTAANIVAVGEKATSTTGAAHITQKPIPASIGHYRTSIVLTMATTQAANSRLFEIKNNGANYIIPTRIRIGAITTGAVTTAYLMRLGLYRLTTFTAVDTTNTVTPTSSIRRSGMTAYPGNAQIRHNTVAGAAAGMTGGTLTKDANEAGTFLYWTSTTVPTAPRDVPLATAELLDDVNGTHPWVFAQNEGFEIENVTVGSGTSNVVQVMIDVCWAEVASY
jgi:hypothetical protein